MLTSVRERSVFPTEHALHAAQPFYWANQRVKDIVKNSDVIVSFDWVDLERDRAAGHRGRAGENSGQRKFTLAHVTIGWVGDAYAYRDPLDFLGHDGGAGLAAGPGLTIGATLALKDSGRPVISVLGDGDFLQGAMALWTAAHYHLPALFIVSNNRSNFNDEIHQETVAKMRGRPTENKWIGQRIDDPAVDIATLARSQGVAAEGPVTTVPALEEAIVRGLDVLRSGDPT